MTVSMYWLTQTDLFGKKNFPIMLIVRLRRIRRKTSDKWATKKEKMTENNVPSLIKMGKKQKSIFLKYHWKLHLQGSCRLKATVYMPKSDFPIPLRHNDFDKQTDTRLDVIHEKSINHYWNVDEDRILSDPCIGVTRFTILSKSPPDGQMRIDNQRNKLRHKLKTSDQNFGHQCHEE